MTSPTTAAKAACPQNEPKNCSGSRPSISGLRVITDDPGATTWTEADSPAAVAVRSIVSLGSAEVTYSDATSARARRRSSCSLRQRRRVGCPIVVSARLLGDLAERSRAEPGAFDADDVDGGAALCAAEIASSIVASLRVSLPSVTMMTTRPWLVSDERVRREHERVVESSPRRNRGRSSVGPSRHRSSRSGMPVRAMGSVAYVTRRCDRRAASPRRMRGRPPPRSRAAGPPSSASGRRPARCSSPGRGSSRRGR